MLRELHALRRKTIDVRRADFFLPEAADIAVAEIVSEEEDDVRPLLRGVCGGGEDEERCEKKTEGFHGSAERYGVASRAVQAMGAPSCSRRRQGGHFHRKIQPASFRRRLQIETARCCLPGSG